MRNPGGVHTQEIAILREQDSRFRPAKCKLLIVGRV
jgi:hypothetical protein